MINEYSSNNNNFTNWQEMIKKEARGFAKGEDLGEVRDIGTEFVVTERGRINKSKFYLPKQLVNGFDGNTLQFDISEQEAEDNFKRDNPPSAGEYSRYQSASVTEQPDTQTNDSGNRRRNLQDFIPLIEKRKIDSMGTESAYTNKVAEINDWDSILKKGVRSQDSVVIGIVTAVNNDNVIVTSDGLQDEFSFAMNLIKSFNGHEVIIGLNKEEVGQFKIKLPR